MLLTADFIRIIEDEGGGQFDSLKFKYSIEDPETKVRYKDPRLTTCCNQLICLECYNK